MGKGGGVGRFCGEPSLRVTLHFYFTLYLHTLVTLQSCHLSSFHHSIGLGSGTFDFDYAPFHPENRGPIFGYSKIWPFAATFQDSLSFHEWPQSGL
jgi:hypothetical protein